MTIGNQTAMIFDTVERATMLITTPMQTNQLQSIPLMKAVAKPAMPCAA